jgi:cation:H+ antiporter
LSPAFVGVTLMAVGTDLPEIASSIAAALTGHGDIALGDTAGSALTQVTLILALLCLALPVRSDPAITTTVGLLTVGALLIVAFLVRDGVLDRWDGVLLILLWVAFVFGMRHQRKLPSVDRPARSGSATRHAMTAFAWLAVVAVGATVVVRSFVEVSDFIGIPTLAASAIVLSIGTSLPELVVDWTAIRRGAMALALGDLFGSSLVDATLALGSGPAIRAIEVSDGAVAVSLIAAVGVGLATLVMRSTREHGRRSAVILLAVYLLATGGFVVVAT